jgi:hypothetical protein
MKSSVFRSTSIVRPKRCKYCSLVGGKLIIPCNCTGTHAHEHCLQEYYSRKEDYEELVAKKHFYCDQCNSNIQFEVNHGPPVHSFKFLWSLVLTLVTVPILLVIIGAFIVAPIMYFGSKACTIVVFNALKIDYSRPSTSIISYKDSSVMECTADAQLLYHFDESWEKIEQGQLFAIWKDVVMIRMKRFYSKRIRFWEHLYEPHIVLDVLTIGIFGLLLRIAHCHCNRLLCFRGFVMILSLQQLVLISVYIWSIFLDGSLNGVGMNSGFSPTAFDMLVRKSPSSLRHTIRCLLVGFQQARNVNYYILMVLMIEPILSLSARIFRFYSFEVLMIPKRTSCIVFKSNVVNKL